MRARVGMLAVALVLPSVASAMSVAEFLAKADALQTKGMAAMFSSDIGLLKAEMMASIKSYRTEVDSGPRNPKLGCPPPKGQSHLTSDQLLADMRRIPAPQRPTTSVKAALYETMRTRFPCR